MANKPCSAENSILETDLLLAVKQDTIRKLKIMETLDGFYIMTELLWAEGKCWYLTTRRDRTAPKMFKDLTRLNKHLREEYPTNIVELHRNQEQPPAGGNQEAKR